MPAARCTSPQPEYPNPEVSKMLEAIMPPDKNVKYEHQLVMGMAADDIVRVAEEQNADLIVIGTHGRTGLKRVLMGSVAEAVMRCATCPVLTRQASEPRSGVNSPDKMARTRWVRRARAEPDPGKPETVASRAIRTIRSLTMKRMTTLCVLAVAVLISMTSSAADQKDDLRDFMRVEAASFAKGDGRLGAWPISIRSPRIPRR